MPTTDKQTLYREAARILIRLSESPDDPRMISERDAFLARGEMERHAYQKAAKAWKASGHKPRNTTPVLIAALCAAMMSPYLFGDPLRVAWLADFKTDLRATQFELASGDKATLDATSAISESLDANERSVTLLRGSAFFDVNKDGRPFVVSSGDLSVEVTGTAFEVAKLGSTLKVAVEEGAVHVRAGQSSWQLNAGQSLSWSGEVGGHLSDSITESIAGWRNDFLVTDGMTFAEVVEMLDRRLPSRIIVASATLADGRMTGGLDLSEPEQALRTVAAARGARLVSTPLLGTFVLSKNWGPQ